MFKEKWTHKVDHQLLYDACCSGVATVNIAMFDAWAKRRAAELGLTLLATDDFVYEADHSDMTIRMSATVMLSADGKAPLIEGEAREMQDIGLLPYIRQIESG